MDESTPLLHNESATSATNEEKSSLEHEKKILDYASVTQNNFFKPTMLQTYWYRWYICLIFAFMGMLQGTIWNTWGPIDESARVAFGFSASEVELLANWGPITFIIFMPLFMWWLDNKGLRHPTIATSFLVAVGSGLRCLPFDVSILRFFIHAGHILNGMAGCVVMAAPPFLSNVWFPPHERITATGIATLFNYLGTGCGFIVGLIVDEPSNSTKNLTCTGVTTHDSNNSCHEAVMIRQEIKNVLYCEFGMAMLIFISMLVFFPNRPALPPSVSASLPRRDLKAGLLELLFHHRQFWVIAIMLSLVLGTWGGWSGVMPIMLKPLNINQKESGLLGLLMSAAGAVAGMLIGWFTDRLKGRMKLMLCLLFSVCLVLFIYFVIIANQWIKVVPFLPHKAEIWTVCLLLGIAINASIPLGMEMAADAGYPICEGTSTSIVVWLFNLLTFIYLLVLGLMNNPLLANYVLLAALLLAVPSLIFFTSEENRRLELDTVNSVNGANAAPVQGVVNPNYEEA